MNSAESKMPAIRGDRATASSEPGLPGSGDRRHPEFFDRRASPPVAHLASDDREKLPKRLFAALADVLARSRGNTIAISRGVAEMIHVELERLLGGLWDARDVARFLGVHRNWVYLQAEAGTLPCVRIGGLVRFEPDTIRAIGRGQQVKGGRVIVIPVARKRIDRE